MARITLPEGDGEERARMWRLRPELGESADSFSATVQDRSILSIREQEAARTRIAHINACIPCSEARMEDVAALGLDEAFYADVDDLDCLGRALVDELASFFETYNDLKGKRFEVRAVSDPERACRLIAEAGR